MGSISHSTNTSRLAPNYNEYGRRSYNSSRTESSEENKMARIFSLFQKVEECKRNVENSFKNYNKANKELDNAKKELFEAIDSLDESTKSTLKNLLDGIDIDDRSSR